MLLSAVVLAGKVIFTKFAVGQMDSMKLILWQHMSGTVAFAVFSLATEDVFSVPLSSINLSVILGLLYQGIIVGGICFVIQANLLQYYTATQISVFAFATPLFGILAAMLFRNDELSPFFAISVVAVAIGIYLVNTRKR